MEWQGYVREQAKGCDAVVVSSRAGREGLYAGIANLIFLPHNINATVTDHRWREVDMDALLGAQMQVQKVEKQLADNGYEINLLEIPHPDSRFKVAFCAGH
jgi:hypothetical protein